jgi:uncharacterized Zn finger protein
MTSLIFSVSSPDGDGVYRMEATKTARGVRFTCTCPEGVAQAHCEHRIALLLGEVGHLASVDPATVAALSALTRGSPLMHAVHRLAQAEAAEAEARADLERARQVLAAILGG